MAGQVMEAPAMHQQQQASSSMLLGQLHQASCKTDHHLAVTTTATPSATIATAAAEMAYLHQLQAAAEAEASNNNGSSSSNGAAKRGEQCPRCASHDTKFCYYNNYNTSQPRHFCRACRRYWTLGGSLRNVPIGGSTRKRPRLAHPPMPPATRRHHPAHVVFGAGAGATVPAGPPTQGLLGSLFALGAGPLLEGRGGFDLGLGLTMPGGAAFGEMQGLGLRGGLGPTSSSALLWPATSLLDNDTVVDAWKVPGVVGATGGAAMWPDFSPPPAVAPQQAGGLLHGGAQLI